MRGDLIGKGTYGCVYLALNVTTGEMMAVRQIERLHDNPTQPKASQVQIVQAFEAELRILEKLEHPNIVQYLGFEKTEKFLNVYVLSPLVRDPSL